MEINKLNKTKFFLLLIIILLPARASIANTIEQETSSGYAPLGAPKNVYVNFAINRLVYIDYVAEEFEIDFYFQMWWEVDPVELNNKLSQDGLSLHNKMPIEYRYLDWCPENDFINAKSISSFRNEQQYVYEQGHIFSETRYMGVFYNEMQLQDFPFDSQDLNITLEDFSKTKEELVYKYGSPYQKDDYTSDTIIIDSEEAFETNLSSSEFRLNEDVRCIITDHLYEFTAGKDVYSQTQLILNITRESGYYMSKIVFVTLLIVVMSWCVFFMDVNDIGSRAGFSITAFLALVGHNFTSNSILPRIPYLTIMDYLTLGSSIMVFLAALENLVVYLVCKKNELKCSSNEPVSIKASDIDKISIWAFPSLLLVLILYVYVLI